MDSFQISKPTRKTGIPKPRNVFGKPEEHPSEGVKKVNEDIASQQAKAQSQIYSALAQDPTIFAFDSFYESFKPQPKSPESSGPKYYEAFKEAADFRNKEKQILRNKAESRAVQDDTEVERFITPSYKKFLQETKQWEASEVPSKKGDFSSLYRNLLTKNKAMGAEPTKVPKKQETQEFTEVISTEETQEPKEVQLSKEEKVLSARERYLQRKLNNGKL
mmetsp:Transcript_7845/g.11569  ORF Transcript_7845/g.11569 Transcript_7845/m.11569 type:complete len:219 (+) Transcript_7845:9-665(+)